MNFLKQTALNRRQKEKEETKDEPTVFTARKHHKDIPIPTPMAAPTLFTRHLEQWHLPSTHFNIHQTFQI